MINHKILLLMLLAVLSGCSTGEVSPGATLLSGLKRYEGDMQSIGSSSSRWPERQRTGGELKALIAGTVGPSRDFFRLVDLDIKKREYAIAIHEINLRPDRLREMTEELAAMNDEMSSLRQLVRGHLAALPFQQQADPTEEVATLGLLTLAVESFSTATGSRGLNAPSTQVNQYLVTDLGRFASVRTPDGKMFRCSLFGAGDDGAGMRCEPGK